MPVILLILGRVHTWVVCGDNDETAADAVIGRCEDRVCRDVDADVLHGAEAADARDGRAVGHLRRDLFVGSPFAVESVLIFGQLFEDLRAGSAGVGRADHDARFISAAGNGLIAGEENVFQTDDHLSRSYLSIMLIFLFYRRT